MLRFLKGLFGPQSQEESPAPKESPAPEESSPDDRARFAHLILSEVKLYDARLLDGLRHDGSLMDKLRKTLQRSYQMYVDRTVLSLEGEKIFREAAVRILANGNTSLLEPALSEVLRQTRDKAGPT
jgi:hypothetical protein